MGSGPSGRELLAGSYQDNMDLRATGIVRGDDGVCIGSDCRTSWPTGSTGAAPSGLTYFTQLNPGAGGSTPRNTWVDQKIFVSQHTGTKLYYKVHARATQTWAGDRLYVRFCYGATVGNEATAEYDAIMTRCGQSIELGYSHNGDRTDIFEGSADITGAPDGSFKYVVLQIKLSSDQYETPGGPDDSYLGNYWWGAVHYLTEK